MVKVMKSSDRAYAVLSAVFIGCLVIATVVARKPINFFGLEGIFGVFPYALTFVITDIIAEIWGKERARSLVIAGVVSLLFAYGFIGLALVWPAPDYWQEQSAYQIVLGNTSRILLAGLAAFLASQFYDVWAFLFFKRATNGKYLWLRTNVSTIPAQIIDSVVFYPIAFAGILPLKSIIIGGLIFKLIVVLVEQFAVYFVVWLLKNPKFIWSLEFQADEAS